MPSAESPALPRFGRSMLKHFCHDPKYTNINTASSGSYPVCVRETIDNVRQNFEAQPDVFVEFKQGSIIEEARLGVANVLGASPDDCVFVRNATTGIFTVLQNLSYKPGDVIVYFNTTYGAIENAIFSLEETRPVRGHRIEYKLPVRPDDLVSCFHKEIRAIREVEGLRPCLAIFDTILSVPGIRFPFEQLTAACKSEGVMSLIDGAHSIGHMRMELDKLQPDFYVTDCHKWLNVPRGCAVLHVLPRHQHLFRTTVPPSFGYIPTTGPVDLPIWAQQSSSASSKPSSAFQTLFKLVPTGDDTPFLCIPTALKFRQEVCGGEDSIYTYLQAVAQEGANRMAEILDTEVLQEPDLRPGEPSQMRRCGIATVRLPLAVGVSKDAETALYPPLTEAEAVYAVQYLSRTLANEYKTWMPMLDLNGWLWVRVCGQVYLEVDDFEWAARVLKELTEKVGKREIDLTSSVAQ